MLQWNGQKILDAVRQSQIDGLLETGATIVNKAKELVRVDSGRLRDAIKVQGDEGNQVTDSGGDFSIVVGVDEDNQGQSVEYAAIQELGPSPTNPHQEYAYTPYMKPAHDQHAKELRGNIAKAFDKLTS